MFVKFFFFCWHWCNSWHGLGNDLETWYWHHIYIWKHGSFVWVVWVVLYRKKPLIPWHNRFEGDNRDTVIVQLIGVGGEVRGHCNYRSWDECCFSLFGWTKLLFYINCCRLLVWLPCASIRVCVIFYGQFPCFRDDFFVSLSPRFYFFRVV